MPSSEILRYDGYDLGRGLWPERAPGRLICGFWPELEDTEFQWFENLEAAEEPSENASANPARNGIFLDRVFTPSGGLYFQACFMNIPHLEVGTQIGPKNTNLWSSLLFTTCQFLSTRADHPLPPEKSSERLQGSSPTLKHSCVLPILVVGLNGCPNPLIEGSGTNELLYLLYDFIEIRYQ